MSDKTSTALHPVLTVLANIVRGIAMGIANIIPGVSGGTIAVVLGIYDRLIEAVSGVFSRGTGFRRHFLFLLQIAIGTGIGIVLFARIIEYLLTNHAVPTSFFFIGLILGSVPAVVGMTRGKPLSGWHVIPFVAALSLIVALSLGPEPASGPGILATLSAKTALLLFLSGVAGAAAMVVPGISGSFILLVIGTYQSILHAVNQRNLAVIAIVGAGAVVGIIVVTRIIKFFLSRYPAHTYLAILGLVIGSVVKLWPGIPGGVTLLMSVVAFAAGGVLALFLGREPNGSNPDSSQGSNAVPSR